MPFPQKNACRLFSLSFVGFYDVDIDRGLMSDTLMEENVIADGCNKKSVRYKYGGVPGEEVK